MNFSIVNAVEENLAKQQELLQRQPRHIFWNNEYRVDFYTSAEADEYQKTVPKNLFRREGNTMIANHQEYLEYLRQQRELKNAFRL